MAAPLIAALLLVPCMCYAASIDELIKAAQNQSETTDVQSFGGENDTEVIRIQLDMLFSLDDWKRLSSEPHSRGRTKRKAWRSITRRWPDGIVPYAIHDTSFTIEDITEIVKAFGEWERFTCIRFRQATAADDNKLVIRDGDGCSSHVGMQEKQPQYLNLAQGCRIKTIISHELGHAIGFVHEQSRADRDSYVQILYENIIPNKEYQFTKFPNELINSYNVPYDYHSLMHYGKKSFSFMGEPTIRTRDPQMEDVIGHGKGLSFRDIKMANLMYRCKRHCTSTLQCEDEGFVGPDCRCWFPGEPVVIQSDSDKGFTKWTPWSCSVTCGIGRESRHRTCAESCSYDRETQTRKCSLPDCQTIVLGKMSLMQDDAPSYVSCPSGYHLHQCDCVPLNHCDGSAFLNLTHCVAYNKYRASGVKAKATCISATYGNNKYINIRAPAAGHTNNPSASCPRGSTLVGCAVNCPWMTDYTRGTIVIAKNECSISQRRTTLSIRCQVNYCEDPGNIPYAAKEGDYYVNDTVTYTCNHGYRIDGGLSGNVTCSHDMKWRDLPQCTREAEYCERTNCPSGYYAPFEGSCYKFVLQPATWLDAVYSCRRANSFLASIETPEENKHVVNYIRDQTHLSNSEVSTSLGYWLSGTDLLQEGTWTWQSTGWLVDYHDWGRHESDGHCLQLSKKSGWKWDDHPCILEERYICEMATA